MNTNLKRLTEQMKLNPPAIKEILDETAAKLKIKFPGQYVEFMLASNGAEGRIGPDSYLVIWPAEQLIALNMEYAVNEFTPGLVYFGSDGGGAAYAFDVRASNPSIVEFPFASVKIEDAKFCGNTFTEFLEYLHQEKLYLNNGSRTYCRIKGYKFFVRKLERHMLWVITDDYEACKLLKMETADKGMYEKWIPQEAADCIWAERKHSEGAGIEVLKGKLKVTPEEIPVIPDPYDTAYCKAHGFAIYQGKRFHAYAGSNSNFVYDLGSYDF